MRQAVALNKVWYGPTRDGSIPAPDVDYGVGLVRGENHTYWGKIRGIRLRGFITPNAIPSFFWAPAYLNQSLGDPTYFPGTGKLAWQNFTYEEYYQHMINGKAIDDEVIRMNADDPDLRAFQKTGGKLLTYHGLADHYSPPQHSAAFYENSAIITGEATADFHRLFLIPGMGHCLPLPGGAGTANIPIPQTEQRMDKLVNWVEKDEAPVEVIARTVGRTKSRPICAYPRLPRYDGKGDVNDAKSFSC